MAPRTLRKRSTAISNSCVACFVLAACTLVAAGRTAGTVQEQGSTGTWWRSLLATKPTLRCRPKNATVACLVNPCQTAKCPGNSNAACLPNYCNGTAYLGSTRASSKPCSAVFYDKTTKKVLSTRQCRAPKPPAVECKPAGVVNCLIDPCQLATCPGVANATCIPNYCSQAGYYNGTLVGGPCSPVFIDNTTKVLLTKDECEPPSLPAAAPILECRPVGTANCFVDPCRFATCPAKPDAACNSNYCGESGYYNGTFVGRPCTAFFTDNTGALLTDKDCALPSPEPTIVCKPSGVSPCFVDPCQFATCPGRKNATCLSNYCTTAGYYNGTLVGKSCSAVFIDSSTKELLSATDCAAPKPPTITCVPKGTVACFVNPCRGASCPANADAQCIPNYCANRGYINGTDVGGACSAVWYDATTLELLTSNDCQPSI